MIYPSVFTFQAALACGSTVLSSFVGCFFGLRPEKTTS
jgi:hypothetical protein